MNQRRGFTPGLKKYQSKLITKKRKKMNQISTRNKKKYKSSEWNPKSQTKININMKYAI